MWDALAREFYGTEKMTSKLLEANPTLCDVIVFESGIVLTVPLVMAEELPSSLPPWRKSK